MFCSLLLLSLGFTIVASHNEPFHRLDYTYEDKFNSFYKLHWDHDGASWESAALACEDEGATLFYPTMTEEWVVVKSLVSAIKLKPNVTDILVGIRNLFGVGDFTTVDGLPSPITELIDQPTGEEPICVTMDSISGSFKTGNCETANVPFICKKQATIEICPTVDTAYVYNKQMRKCYKISERKKTWINAMETCSLEGGSLLLIKNSIEAEIIKNIVIADVANYFVGFRRMRQTGEYYTITGEKFDGTFYTKWRNNEGDCGTIFKKYDVIYTQMNPCLAKTSFVCEMPPKIYTWSNSGNQLPGANEKPANVSCPAYPEA